MPDAKIYLGDGAYAEIKNGEVELTTSDGLSMTNRIVLGRQKLINFVGWLVRLGVVHVSPPFTRNTGDKS